MKPGYVCISNRGSLFHKITSILEENYLKKSKYLGQLLRPGYEVFAQMPPPRFIKTHFPLSLLPGILDSGCKVHLAKKRKVVK